VNIVLWVLQILLAVVFVGAGLAKLTQPREKLRTNMGWVDDVPPGVIKLTGAAEVLGAIGLVVPWLTGIAPVLTPLAAVGLIVVMIGAAITHVRRGEWPMVAANLALLALNAVVAVGRF
jgi:uncharacterized membrane protein YphA (DoxX/SURF4 family)